MVAQLIKEIDALLKRRQLSVEFMMLINFQCLFGGFLASGYIALPCR